MRGVSTSSFGRSAGHHEYTSEWYGFLGIQESGVKSTYSSELVEIEELCGIRRTLFGLKELLSPHDHGNDGIAWIPFHTGLTEGFPPEERASFERSSDVFLDSAEGRKCELDVFFLAFIVS